MTPLAVRQVDAFTTTPFQGNPAAIVDGGALTGEQMQRIALEMNLSETVFLFPPQSPETDARIRIFTPRSELPFAGHPIVASTHILVEEGRVARSPAPWTVRLETGAGIIPVEVGESEAGPIYTMTQSPPQFESPQVGLEELAAALRVRGDDLLPEAPPLKVSTGVWHLVVPLRTLSTVRDLRPDMTAVGEINQRENTVSLTVLCLEAEGVECQARIRTFAPQEGIPEDPVCGSCNGCVAAHISRHSLLEKQDGICTYVAEQGVELGRPGRVHVSVCSQPGQPDVIRVGGAAVTVLRGFIEA